MKTKKRPDNKKIQTIFTVKRFPSNDKKILMNKNCISPGVCTGIII